MFTMRNLLILSSVIAVAGCGGEKNSYMPLTQGREWGYEVRAGFQRSVATLRAVEKTAVGPVPGWRLEGSLGESRIGWKGSRLVASELANCRFSAPIPILDTEKIPQKSKSQGEKFAQAHRWAGKIESFGVLRPATATLNQRQTRLENSKVDLVQTMLTINLQGSVIEVRTWFEKSKGIVRQEQRTNGNLVVTMDLLKYE